ncbi:hypothetical protein SMACR_06158 [Sordaria macrospora]|uniref:WGS project CABT00000000 data, contig 2.33 n=2 Tax=Sordaria macrospora TaxID=5147 RepID=F7W677_SORMK|nr:uncharacterized protein SMAC_06158 [Sordaria macrospora k-hell]KAA8633393.1 hypothetical protein SMACR_06158 [Sordaria macrospora]WPJ66982.1 hypothetical protein SMAC4_06158 [Sordaria macrospora]CCC13015.1 unnamed protein product [Sordaria macrospora k-hell]
MTDNMTDNMTDQTPTETPNNSQMYSTWKTFTSCFADPEAVLALFLENQKNKKKSDSGKQGWSCKKSEENESDENNKKIREQRCKRIIAWYLFFTIYNDEIWENDEFEKLKKLKEQQQGQQGEGRVLSDRDRKDDEEEEYGENSEDDSEDDDEEEQEECRKRMMLRQEIIADWKSGNHPFFYDDEDMPDTSEQDDRIYKMSLIFHCPKWQDLLEESVQAKRKSEGYNIDSEEDIDYM